ncbi:LHFPL tetraspan subfamily member 6 protein [Parasteatoda tepidariorum]|uniref:LHFPL tetraspan subfamily member 6 protein n=1 Tax=Parasteatoda tepidariorum TaxID=114398 RepID=UPI00077FB0D6|nr:LHFPL tetraspan subfamily member 2a protein [Parasteatoda tepidariorum]
MYREILEYFQLEQTHTRSSDYVLLRQPLWYSFSKEIVEHKHYVNAERWETSWTVVVMWTLLSLLVTFTCTTGFVETEWFVRENSTSNEQTILSYDRSSLVYTLSMFNVCYRDKMQASFHCHRFEITRFPSTAWQGTCLLYGMGCVLQGFGTILLIICLVNKSGAIRRAGALLSSYAHVAAGLLQTLGLLLYPLILDTYVGRLHCGNKAHAYGLDFCRIGWAYVASAAGTLLTFYCPFLAYFSFYKVYKSYNSIHSEPDEAHLNPNFMF